MRVERIDRLEQYILDKKSVSLDALCEKFDVSKNTLRRDIDTLVKKGTIDKVYGGVIAVEKNHMAVGLKPFNERNLLNLDLKERIAAKAAEFVKEGDTIFLDTGSSTLPIVSMLSHLNDVTIVTNSVPAIYSAINYPNIKVIALPGTLNRSTDSLVGAGCLDSLKNFHLKKAFMSCTGLSVDGGVCNASFAEYEIKRGAMGISAQRFLLADHSKFQVSAMMQYSSLDKFDYLITDKSPDSSISTFCEEHDTRIIY